MAVTAQTIGDAALRIIGQMGLPGRGSSPEQQVEYLQVFNYLLDSYSVMRSMIYTVSDLVFALTANTQFYFIGDGAVATSIGGVPYGAIDTPRPNQLLRCNIIYQTSPQIARLPVELIDYNEWLSLRVPDIFAIPLKLYYDYNFSQTAVGGSTGLGVLSFWPGPQAAYQVELAATSPLSDGGVLIGDAMLFPPGYVRALTNGLAWELAVRYPARMNPATTARLEVLYDESRRTLEMLNSPASTAAIDPALAGRGNDEFNWLVSLG